VEDIAGLKFAGRHVGEVAPKELKPIATAILKDLGTGIVALVSTQDGKAAIITAVSEDLSAQHSAVDLVRAAAAAVGGSGGGGSKTLAQAGGPDGANWEAALTAVRTALAG
jgi:alanyl-tRNA synthetase